VRGAYTFLDVPEAVADQVVEGLSNASDSQGKNFFVKKAVTLSIPREGAAPTESSESDGGGDFEGEPSNGSIESHEGPTMLAVDEQN
jgi:hypothetical protein